MDNTWNMHHWDSAGQIFHARRTHIFYNLPCSCLAVRRPAQLATDRFIKHDRFVSCSLYPVKYILLDNVIIRTISGDPNKKISETFAFLRKKNFGCRFDKDLTNNSVFFFSIYVQYCSISKWLLWSWRKQKWNLLY